MAWRRRKSVVSPRQQVWFGLEVVFVAIGFIVLCAFLLFIPPMSDWFGSEDSSGWLLEELNRVILMKWPMVFVALIVLFVIGVLMAHRLAGPMLGLRNVIAAWLGGNRKARVRFRRYDYLLPMQDSINLFLENEERVGESARELASAVVAGKGQDETRKKAEDLLTLLKLPEGGK